MGTREWLLLVEESGWPTPPCPPWHMRRASNMGGFSTSSAPKIHHLRNPPKCLTMSNRHNIADSVTSISCGLLMTMVGLFSKAACLSTYAWVHTHYRLVDLPWNSPWTWIITAVLVDLGYYWWVHMPGSYMRVPSRKSSHRVDHRQNKDWLLRLLEGGCNTVPSGREERQLLERGSLCNEETRPLCLDGLRRVQRQCCKV